jgi:hypothetical protein
MQHFYERRDASPHYMPSHSHVQTGRFAELETDWQAGQSGTHFALVGEICPQAPLNDFCKIGCAPAELSSPAARQGITALCEYDIDTFSVSGYT